MRIVTIRNIYAAFATNFAFCSIWTVVTEIFQGRQFLINTLTCQMQQNMVNIIIQTILFVLIPLIIIIYCLRMLYICMKEKEKYQTTVTIARNADLRLNKNKTEIKNKMNNKHNAEVSTSSRTTSNEVLSAQQVGVSHLHPQLTEMNQCSIQQNSISNTSSPSSHDDGTSDPVQEQTSGHCKSTRINLRSPNADKFGKKTFMQNAKDCKIFRMITILTGTFLALQIIPFIVRLAIEAMEVKNINEGPHYTFPISIQIKRYADLTYALIYPCVNPLILIRFDKEYATFRKKFCFGRYNKRAL